MQDEFQKKVLDTLKKNFKAVDISEEKIEINSLAIPNSESGLDEASEQARVLMTSSDFTAFGAPTSNGPTSGGNKDILILPGYGGAAATSASLINFYWNSPITPDITGVGTSIRSTIYNYATSTTNPVLVFGGYNGTVNYMPFPNYGGGSGVTAKIWIDPFLGRIETDYIGFNSGVADTNVAGVLFYDSTLNVFKGGNGSGVGKTIAFTSDIPAQASSAALVNTDVSTGTRFLVGTLLNTASSGGTSLSTGSGITIGNNVLTATTFQGSLSGTATTAINAYVTAQTTGTFYPVFTSTSSTTNGVALSVESTLSWNAATDTLTAGTFSGTLSGTATSAARVSTDATTGTRYLVGTVLNTASGNTQLSTGSGITIGDNRITATTFAGNATTATNAGAAGQWSSSRTVTFATGDVTGSFSIDGTANVSNVALTIGANSVALGTDTTGNYAQSVAVAGNGLTIGGAAGEGTDFTVYSNGVSANTVSTLVFRDGSGNFSAGTITANLTGTASIATTATRAQTVDVSLDGAGSFGGMLFFNGLVGGTGVTLRTGNVTYDTNSKTIAGAYFSGGAFTSANAVTVTDTSNTLYLLGSRSSTGVAATQIYVDTNVSIVGSTITASLSGTATTALNQTTTTLSGTMYLHGQASSTGVATGTTAFVASGLSFISSTGTLGASFYTGSGIQLSGIVTSLASSTGISVNSATGAVTVTNTGVISLTGTANQVLVNGASGVATSSNITLTTPQSIGTASSPSFADVALTTGTNSTVAAVGSAPTSMVNKQYVDNLAAGLDIHDSMRVLQASAVLANYVQSQTAGAAATSAYLISTTQVALPAIDGVTISSTGASQRVLINGGFTGTATIGGTTPFTPGNSFISNGSYYVAALGGAGTSNWILVRTTDGDDNAELTGGTFTFIEEGTSYADSGWVCSNDTTNNGPIQFGNTAISFTQFTGGGALGVGQGLTKVGNTLAANIKIAAVGAASGIGYTQFNLGGTSGGGTADTGYYPTFAVRTSGAASGTAILTLNSDGFSLIGSTNSSRTVTVTGSDITLTGGGNTLTLTGSISLPAPTANGLAYGASASAVAFLTAAGSGASILTQTSGSAPVFLGQSQLVVGGASTAANIQGGATNQLHYQTGSNTTGFITLAAGSGASILTQTSGSAPVYLPQSQLLVGTATSAALVNTDASTATRFLVGTVLNTASGSTQLSTGSGITIGDNRLTSGGIAVTNTTVSTSTTSGALTVAGGVGVGLTSYFAQDVKIQGSTASTTPITGALTVTGGVGIGGALNVNSNGNFTGDLNGSLFVGIDNSNTGSSASSELFLVNSTVSTVLGVGSTSNSGIGGLVSSLGVPAGYGYLFTFRNGTTTGGMSVGAGSTLVLFVNQNGTGSSTRIILTGTGATITAVTASTSSTTGALTVSGGAGIAKTSYFGQDVVIQGATGSGSTTTGALTVVGGVGIGGTLNVGPRNLSYSAAGLLAGFASSINGYAQVVVQNASTGATASSDFIVNNNLSTDTTYYGAMGMNSSGFTGSGSLNSPNAVYFTSTTGDLVLGSTTANILRFVYNSGATDSMQITGTAVSVLYTTASTSTSTGALTVAGGVGVGGSLWTATANFSSISGVGFLNSVITSGTWNGTAVSLTYGGTNANLTAVNGGVVYSTGSAMAISAAGTAGSVLVSAGAAAPTWSAIGLSSSSVVGVLGIANGGNNATTYTTNGITFFDGTKMSGTSSLTYVSGAGVTATENIRAAGFNIAGNSVVTSLTPSGGSTIYGGVTIAVANNGSGPGLSVSGASSTITITGPGTGITGSGTANNVPKFTASGTLGNSNITDNGTTIALGKATTITDSALSNGTYLTITTASGDDNSTTDFFIRGLNSSSTSKFSVDANGNLRATTKSFDIEHPTKPGKRLVYGVLEGPEHGVYHRGTIEGKGKLTVELPEYWSKLVGAEYSIQLTPWGNYNAHIVEKSETSFIIQLTGDPISRMFKTIKVDYIIHGSRLDAPLVIEQ